MVLMLNFDLIFQAPGQVAFDYNQANREKNKQWLADLGILKKFIWCILLLYALF